MSYYRPWFISPLPLSCQQLCAIIAFFSHHSPCSLDPNGALHKIAKYNNEVLSKFQAQCHILPSWGSGYDLQKTEIPALDISHGRAISTTGTFKLMFTCLKVDATAASSSVHVRTEPPTCQLSTRIAPGSSHLLQHDSELSVCTTHTQLQCVIGRDVHDYWQLSLAHALYALLANSQAGWLTGLRRSTGRRL